MRRNLCDELRENAGRIYLPNGEWWEPEKPLLPVFDGDVWSFAPQILVKPEFEQGFSVMMHSAEARGDCGPSGDAWANFIVEHATFRASGDLFDWQELFVDRDGPEEILLGEEMSLSAVLGVGTRHTMKRLRKKAARPSTRLASKRMLPRLCVYGWVWKVYAVRAGFGPEFCEQRII